MAARKTRLPKLPPYTSRLSLGFSIPQRDLKNFAAWETGLKFVPTADDEENPYFDQAFDFFEAVEQGDGSSAYKRAVAALALEATMRGVFYWHSTSPSIALDKLVLGIDGVCGLFTEQLASLFGPTAVDCIPLHQQIDLALPSPQWIARFVDYCALEQYLPQQSICQNLSGACVSLGGQNYLLFGHAPRRDNSLGAPPAVYCHAGHDGNATFTVLGKDNATPAHTIEVLAQIPPELIEKVTNDFNGTVPMPISRGSHVFALVYGGGK